MDRICPICGRNANVRQVTITENEGKEISQGSKTAAKFGGKTIGKYVGGAVGDLVGMSEVGSMVGGAIGGYWADAAIDKYADANSHKTYRSYNRYSCCGMEWGDDDDEMVVINRYFIDQEIENKAWVWIPISFIPYGLLLIGLIFYVFFDAILFFCSGLTGIAWSSIRWWFLHTWMYHLASIVVVLLFGWIYTSIHNKSLQRKRNKFFCQKYDLHIGRKRYTNGTYYGTFNKYGQRHGAGTFKVNNTKTICSGVWYSDRLVWENDGGI